MIRNRSGGTMEPDDLPSSVDPTSVGGAIATRHTSAAIRTSERPSTGLPRWGIHDVS
jgi:hypothetical protein